MGLRPPDFETWTLRDLDALWTAMRRQQAGPEGAPVDDAAFAEEQRQARAEWEAAQKGEHA